MTRYGQFSVARKLILNGGAIRPTGLLLLSSATNMVTQIIYLGRMEVGGWYYAVVFLMGFKAVWT